MLHMLGLEPAELSVLLTNDTGIRELNRAHRRKDRPTDVLSFWVNNDHFRTAQSPRFLGDVVISLDTAQRQAQSRRRELILEIRWLLAHGLLHLVGYDHGNALEKKRMVAQTKRLVKTAQLPHTGSASGSKVPSGCPRPGTPGRPQSSLPCVETLPDALLSGGTHAKAPGSRVTFDTPALEPRVLGIDARVEPIQLHSRLLRKYSGLLDFSRWLANWDFRATQA